MYINQHERTKIIPIAGGKGGAGKSLIAANLGILMALNGRKTVVIDFDLGSANLHSYLGERNNNLGLGNYFAHTDSIDFESLRHPTQHSHLTLIPGDVLVPGACAISHAQRESVLKKICALKADYVFIDAPSGSSTFSLDIFHCSDSGILVSTPTIPATLSIYNFLKNSIFHRFLRAAQENEKAYNVIKKSMCDVQPRSTPDVGTVIQSVAQISPKLKARMEAEVEMMHPYLIVNRMSNEGDWGLIDNLRTLVRDMLGIRLECLGVVFEDAQVENAVRAQRPLAIAEEEIFSNYQLERIAQKLLLSPDYPLMPLETTEYADSFELAKIESANDFEEYGMPNNRTAHPPLIVQDTQENKTQPQPQPQPQAGAQAGASAQDSNVEQMQKKITELESMVRILSAGRK